MVSVLYFFFCTMLIGINILRVGKSCILPSFRLAAHLALIVPYGMQTDPNWSYFLYEEAKKSI